MFTASFHQEAQLRPCVKERGHIARLSPGSRVPCLSSDDLTSVDFSYVSYVTIVLTGTSTLTQNVTRDLLG